jgi:hypothetical protein
VLEPVPSLDQLAEDPGKLSALSPALVLALRCRLTVLLAHVEHQVAVQGLAPTTPPARDGGETRSPAFPEGGRRAAGHYPPVAPQP